MRAHVSRWLLLTAVLCTPVGAQQDMERVRAGMDAMMRHYDPSQGLWKTEGWWNAANSTTVLGEAAEIDPASKYYQALETTFVKAQTARPGQETARPNFINNFYDDEGWWALAWIQAYDATHRPDYLHMAESIFSDMSGGWDSTCGGGLWWTKDRTYKNAIPNELYLSVAAHLANRTEGEVRIKYLDWAKREWAWFARSGMINANGLVNDGLTASCTNNARTTWSYNQGVVLGGLVELSRATRDPSAIQMANTLAHAAINMLADENGVLHDPSEPHCSPDTVQFKGIFIRNLVALDLASPHAEYEHFVEVNASAVWNKARSNLDGFACRWSGPAEDRGAGATTSAIEALFGVLQLKGSSNPQKTQH